MKSGDMDHSSDVAEQERGANAQDSEHNPGLRTESCDHKWVDAGSSRNQHCEKCHMTDVEYFADIGGTR